MGEKGCYQCSAEYPPVELTGGERDNERTFLMAHSVSTIERENFNGESEHGAPPVTKMETNQESGEIMIPW